MSVIKEDVQRALDKITEYLYQHNEEWVFGEKVIPVMLRTIKSFETELNDIEKKSVNAAKEYWEGSGNASDFKQAKEKLMKYKHTLSEERQKKEYYITEAIQKTLYTFDEWDDESENALAYFGSNLIEAGVKLDVFYKELKTVFSDCFS